MANYFTAADGAKSKKPKNELVRFGSSYTASTSTRALEHEHEHESTNTSTRALEHEPEVARQSVRETCGTCFLTMWVCMRLGGSSWSPWLLASFSATLNPQSTCHGPRPGPTLAPWSTGGLPACRGAESTRNDPRSGEKKMLVCKKKRLAGIELGGKLRAGSR